MMQLLEIALVDEMDKAPDTLQPCSVDSLVDLLPSVTSSSCGNEFDNHTKCGPQGVNCSRPGSCSCGVQSTFDRAAYTFEHLVQMIFPSSKQWMDDLMRPIFFLHLEGVKLRPKVERSYSSCAKATCSSELENVVFHEDEAHFGDLFCESGRGLQKDMISHQLFLTLAPARTRNIDRLCLSWDDIFSTMSSILGFWKAKHAAVVEDLGIERDIFVFCWDFPTIGTAKGPSASFREQSTDA